MEEMIKAEELVLLSPKHDAPSLTATCFGDGRLLPKGVA
jgi:hypothetical protein